MSTTQVGRGLEAHGVQTSKPVHFNLSAAALYEHAIRRQEGVIAPEGPLVCRTGAHTGRSPNDKFVVKEPSSEAHVWWGKVNRPIDAGAVRRAAPRHRRAPQGQGAVRAGLLRRRRPGLPPAGARHQRVRLAQPVRPQPVHRAARRRTWPAPAAVHGHRRADVQGRSGAARHALRRRHRRELRDARSAHRRHELRRRDQEVDLHACSTTCCRCRACCRCTARPTSAPAGDTALFFGLSGTGKTTLSSDPDRAADRRRRARLERSRRVQLRGRLLREDDPAVGRGRAADLRDDAALRHRARERRHRSGRRARSNLDDASLHREHARARIRSRSSTTPCRRAAAAIRRTS